MVIDARSFRAAFIGCAAAAWTGLAFASGREGAGIAEAVAILVMVVVGTFVAALVIGVGVGLARNRNGESVPRSLATGLKNGFFGFLILAGAATALVWIGGIAFVVYAFMSNSDVFGDILKELIARPQPSTGGK
jgi:hypothetical protein